MTTDKPVNAIAGVYARRKTRELREFYYRDCEGSVHELGAYPRKHAFEKRTLDAMKRKVAAINFKLKQRKHQAKRCST